MADLTKHYLISGRVQGVGFRAFTQRQAAALGLRGWARNLADGRVEVVACGADGLLTEFEGKLRQGPSRGFVESLTSTIWQTNDLPPFEIRKDGPKPCSES